MTKDLIDIIIEGIQDKKGRNIVVADLRNIPTASTDAFVICTAGSPAQADSMIAITAMMAKYNHVRLNLGIFGSLGGWGVDIGVRFVRARQVPARG